MARRRPASVHGLLVIDKPTGCTSHDVVDRVRRVLGERRVGHSGTLDPDASGVLLIGVGQATRLLRFLDMAHLNGKPTTYKVYSGTVVLGTETDSLDATGEIVAEHDMSELISSMTPASIQSVIDTHLVGDIMQIPPMVSALRVDGKRLHELAREGIEIDREPRPVTVHEFQVLATHDNMIDIRVECSSGTYIRTLAADLGHLLGGGAHLRDLRRTSIGSFGIDIAIPLATFEALDQESARNSLRPILDTCRSLSRISVSDEQRRSVSVGSVLPQAMFSGEPPWAVVHQDESGVTELLAVYEPFSNERVGSEMARPIVVLVAPPSPLTAL
ncbi:MAG: tRNA pseudouridine(55) synthase TruB [Actinomycetota bacterium]